MCVVCVHVCDFCACDVCTCKCVCARVFVYAYARACLCSCVRAPDRRVSWYPGAQILAAVKAANDDAHVDGILVQVGATQAAGWGLRSTSCPHTHTHQLPLPKGLDDGPILRAITPDKDVDGLHEVRVALGGTPRDTQRLLSARRSVQVNIGRLAQKSKLRHHIACTPRVSVLRRWRSMRTGA